MVADDNVMRAARNGFLVLILALLAASIYEFFVLEQSNLIVPGLWTVGVLVFYGSKYYYKRQDSDEQIEE